MRYKEQHRPMKAPFAYIRVSGSENQTVPHPEPQEIVHFKEEWRLRQWSRVILLK